MSQLSRFPITVCPTLTLATMAAHAKKFKDKTKEHVKQTKEQVDEALGKVRSQPWSEPLGQALSVTGTIVSGCGNFVPFLGMAGGALNMGSKLLNPKASMNDLRRAQETGCNAFH